jgi:hypothetical protein
VGISGREEGKWTCQQEGIRLMYFIDLYEKRTMKLVEIILRKGEGVRNNDGADESNKGTL